MSEVKTKFPYSQMMPKAVWVANQLARHCVRIEIAGSLRRKCKDVSDIEIVLIPFPFETGLFTSGVASVIDQWKVVKGHLDKHCKYSQRLLPDGTKIDLFFVEPGNWGNQLAVRTGSANYSHHVLANGWVRAGFVSESGYLWKGKVRHEVKEEKDLFELIGIPWLAPEKRNM